MNRRKIEKRQSNNKDLRYRRSAHCISELRNKSFNTSCIGPTGDIYQVNSRQTKA